MKHVYSYLAYKPFGVLQSETQYYNVKDGDGNLMSTVSTPGNYSSIYSNSTSSSNGSSTTYLSIYGSNGTDNAYHSFSNTPDGRTIVPHGSASFKKQFAKDLEMLSKTDRGKEIVAFLQSPSFQINIHESAWAKSGFNPATNSVYYDNDNAFDYDYDGVEYVSFIALGHELQHAYDKYNMSGFSSASMVKKERSAVYFENYLRSVYRNELSDRGIPFALRYTYSKGTSLFLGRVLISGKSTTLFNSNKKENYFNPDLERINSGTWGQSMKTYNLGDRHINMTTPGFKFNIKTYDNKKSSKHGTVLYL